MVEAESRRGLRIIARGWSSHVYVCINEIRKPYISICPNLAIQQSHYYPVRVWVSLCSAAIRLRMLKETNTASANRDGCAPLVPLRRLLRTRHNARSVDTQCMDTTGKIY